MYRYSVDNAVTYNSGDIVLFREAPFACWMERLTLENPDHGILPDAGSVPPGEGIEPQDELADTLSADGKNVRLIDWDADEAHRRDATLEAMHEGVDFIVNGQLALGPLSGAANLLVRTSGFSELGHFLYLPCDTQARAAGHSAFRLCFLADLLHSLQGQLPPQMLVIRDGDDLLPLLTESHIYHYRAVKQRFMAAMSGFRKHRMPDPAESSHFGRWSDCAYEVLKQRMLREDREGEDTAGAEDVEPMRKVMAAASSDGAPLNEPDDMNPPVEYAPGALATAISTGDADAGSAAHNDAPVTLTLVEQARRLQPGTYKPGPGFYRLGPPRAAAPAAPAQPGFNRRASDAVAKNLELIGSAAQTPGTEPDAAVANFQPVPGAAPSPSLREQRGRTAS